MATTRYTFTPESAGFPTSAFAALTQIGTGTYARLVLAFDGATDEDAFWTFVAPQGLSGALSAVISYCMASAVTGTVRFEAKIEATTPGDTDDLDAAAHFGTTNSNGGTVPATTAGKMGQIEVTLTNADSIAAGDYCRLNIHRDADGTTGTDDVTTDLYVLAVELREA